MPCSFMCPYCMAANCMNRRDIYDGKTVMINRSCISVVNLGDINKVIQFIKQAAKEGETLPVLSILPNSDLFSTHISYEERLGALEILGQYEGKVTIPTHSDIGIMQLINYGWSMPDNMTFLLSIDAEKDTVTKSKASTIATLNGRAIPVFHPFIEGFSHASLVLLAMRLIRKKGLHVPCVLKGFRYDKSMTALPWQVHEIYSWYEGVESSIGIGSVRSRLEYEEFQVKSSVHELFHMVDVPLWKERFRAGGLAFCESTSASE